MFNYRILRNIALHYHVGSSASPFIALNEGAVIVSQSAKETENGRRPDLFAAIFCMVFPARLPANFYKISPENRG